MESTNEHFQIIYPFLFHISDLIKNVSKHDKVYVSDNMMMFAIIIHNYKLSLMIVKVTE